MKIYSIIFLSFILFFTQVNIKVKASNNIDVNLIDWVSISKEIPNNSDSERIKTILLNTNKYGLTTWWNKKKNFDEQTDEYIEFGGKSESEIRHPAAMSLGLATSLAFGIYDPNYTNVTMIEAKNRTKKLISSIAYRHRANSTSGWGGTWQSAHWAYFAGFSGWLLWNELSKESQSLVRQMVEYEANRFVNYSVPYWKNGDGQIVFKGDTKAEENSWNAQILQLATAMMPEHVNWNMWMNKNIELMISSASVPSDKDNDTLLHGKAVKDWVNGSNINENGTVINHGFIHPDYMEFIAFNNTSGLHYTLANMKTPEAAFFHSDLVYKGLVDLQFNSPPYLLPGGTIYQAGLSDIYYPEGNDWGTQRRMQFVTLDIFADVFDYDYSVTKKGSYWEKLHAQKVLEMQNRHVDGRTYSGFEEDTYEGREEWVAHHAAWAWMAKWVESSNRLKKTNQSFGPTFNQLDGNTRFDTAAMVSSEGWVKSDVVLLVRSDTFPDALAGTPLAYQEDAPILLTEKDQLSVAAKKEIQRLDAKKIIVLGGFSAVSRSVEESLKNLELEVDRIAGGDRFETARKIAERINNRKNMAVLVSGYNFPDALSAAGLAAKEGYPILLSKTNQVPYHTSQALKGISKVYVIGGKAVIHDTVLQNIPFPTRIGGLNRFDTNLQLINTFNLSSSQILLANGRSFPDALTGSVLAAKKGYSLLLVETSYVPSESLSIINNYDINHYTVLGGNEVIQETVIISLMK